MLPNLRLMLAGAAALFLVTLGALSLLTPRASTPRDAAPRVVAAAFGPRGALISPDDHPEWRQFLVLAALRRASELEKLKQLPDDRTDTPPLRWASLPADAPDHAPQEAAEALSEVPSATIPVDIGEASSTELPVTQIEEPVPPPAAPRAIERSSEPSPASATPEPAPAAPAPPSSAEADARQAAAQPAEPADADPPGAAAPLLAAAEVPLPQARPDISTGMAKAATAKPVKRAAKRKLRRIARTAAPATAATPQTDAPVLPFSTLFGPSNPTISP